ncbi:hypothetical protein PCYB_005390 [Plasmodium cynomolgi strain B]|uniref:Uncharacterized protein n=1 Tax=Plasmodium cynomolgi (strain B) TaxID=1120755 RepID=K6V367_PLACD|nr:hypothetical protein PCYB_005390 [Plasmodium cynomolgi strain B]GAB69790.1 hypothetical protein PCYB_005390 [Plasmodium cynomolgi strain B]
MNLLFYEEPLNIIKLENFQEEIGIIKSILEKKNDSINSCKRYVCECYKIYMEMNERHCLNEDLTNSKVKSTCDKLIEFVLSYMADLFGKDGVKYNIPSFPSSNIQYVNKCELTLNSEVPISTYQESSVNPKKSIVTGTLGTMAGVSSVMALLYKVITNFYLNM